MNVRAYWLESLRISVALVCCLLKTNPSAADDWPQWRGPLGTGEAPGMTPPVHWSETRNVRWKVRLPGLGHSTPLIGDDTLYVTTAVRHGEPFRGGTHDHPPGAHDNKDPLYRLKFTLIALATKDGHRRWSRVL